MSVIKKTLNLALVIIVLTFACISTADAGYVKGYTKSNGTYVNGYWRSDANGLKYDNYSWTPSQGLYNDTYGTKGSSWDTPTWYTQDDYWQGWNSYSQKNSDFTLDGYDLYNNTMSIPSNSSTSSYGGWVCNSGYVKNYVTNSCDKVIVPANATLNWTGSGWTCNSGYKRNYVTNSCNKVVVPANATLGRTKKQLPNNNGLW